METVVVGSPAIDGDRRTMWIFEPKVLFESWVEENDIQVYRDEWLDRVNGKTEGVSTISISTPGNTYRVICFWTAPMKDLWPLLGFLLRWTGSHSVYGET